MDASSGAVLAIVLMALATYATRAGGFWLSTRFRLSGRVGVFLEYIPGAILVSLIAPVVLAGGAALWISAACVALVSWRTGSLLASLIVGVGLVSVLRYLGLG